MIKESSIQTFQKKSEFGQYDTQNTISQEQGPIRLHLGRNNYEDLAVHAHSLLHLNNNLTLYSELKTTKRINHKMNMIVFCELSWVMSRIHMKNYGGIVNYRGQPKENLKKHNQAQSYVKLGQESMEIYNKFLYFAYALLYFYWAGQHVSQDHISNKCKRDVLFKKIPDVWSKILSDRADHADFSLK